MLRQTKIVATFGPATDKPGVSLQLLESGVNVVRLNFSHGNAQDHQRRAHQVREHAKKLGLVVAILGDLQGPKIRIANFAEGAVQLRNGKLFSLDATFDTQAGNEDVVGLDYPQLVGDCHAGDILLLDDGRIRLRVEQKNDTNLVTRVIAGGTLSNRKGINRLGGGINAPALTEKDYRDIELASKIGCDYLALSFVRDANDIAHLRERLSSLDYHPYLVAKIERSEAVQAHTIDSIIDSVDCIMVARGDLGVELGEPRLVAIQKRLISRAATRNRSVITATQMMESMIENIIPTRAEVFDVANAVIDGTDAVMLSAETASGKYPVKVVQAMAEICKGAETEVKAQAAVHRISDKVFEAPDEAIAYASLHTALQLKNARAIVSYTESGNTPLWISRIRGDIPIVGVSRNIQTLRRIAMWRGVFPVNYDITKVDRHDIAKITLMLAARCVHLRPSDTIILTRGSRAGVSGTDRMQIIKVTNQLLTEIRASNTS